MSLYAGTDHSAAIIRNSGRWQGQGKEELHVGCLKYKFALGEGFGGLVLPWTSKMFLCVMIENHLQI